MTHVNGPPAAMGSEHVILWGRGRAQYHVANFPGPLSIKSVVTGEARWRTADASFEVDRGSLLVLNRGQNYTITIEPGRGAVETLCVFFRDGYVEQGLRRIETALDNPFEACGSGFFERLHRKDGPVAAALSRLRHGLLQRAGMGWIEDRIHEAASALTALQGSVEVERRRVPALKVSTREEIYRRLQRGRQTIEGRPGEAVSLDEAARQACLSAFHFQRLFKETFRETPHEFGRRLRLERAARLLQETRMPVTEICLETGFQSLGSFCALFRRRYGDSPRAIRKNEEVLNAVSDGK